MCITPACGSILGSAAPPVLPYLEERRADGSQTGLYSAAFQWGLGNARLDKPLACWEAGIPGAISDRRFSMEGNSWGHLPKSRVLAGGWESSLSEGWIAVS